MSKKKSLYSRIESFLDLLEPLVPRKSSTDFDNGMAWQWRKEGFSGQLKLVETLNNIRLEDLQHIDHQKTLLVRNTKQFLAGMPANNALLWGPRGTGKSSLIKAILNAYGPEGLKLIEVERDQLVDLPAIIERITESDPQCAHKYVIFCDDLSFDEKDTTYRALKVVLDGSVLSTPENIVIYATSNRRHLVPEKLRDNLDAKFDSDGEIHQSEAVEERISLSERFGLWVSFHPFNQERYLQIVEHWLESFDEKLDDAAREAALQWALLHGSRSGRSAQQFARDWAGQHQLNR
ncbi:MAG: ATP-binding protein [Gammaproteobacteria bacterium]